MSKSISTRAKKNGLCQGPRQELDGAAELRPSRSYHNLRFADEPELNDGKVESSMNKLHQLIIYVVASLSKIVTIDEQTWPQMCDTHIWFEELDALFHQAMGLKKEERLDHAFRRLKVDRSLASVYLRMLVAAEVCDKVLTATFPEIPMPDRGWAKRALKSLAEHERLEELSCESNAAQLALLRTFAEDEELKNKAHQRAENFVNDLLEIINPMLLSYKSTTVDREASKTRKALLRQNSGKILQDIYFVALKLRIDMNLKRCTYAFVWPAVDEPFDASTMDAEVHEQRVESPVQESRKDLRVAATLLPGVRRIEPSQLDQAVKSPQELTPSLEDNSSEGIVIHKGLVYLRS